MGADGNADPASSPQGDRRRPISRDLAIEARRAGAAPDGGGLGAAFFDLDRTLMEGSSAFQFGRAAYRHGLMSRRQLLADAWANLRFRMRGATDTDTAELRDRISSSLQGVRVRELERLGADVLAGILPRIDRDVLAIAHRHQDEGREVYIVTAAAHDLAEMLARVLALDGAIGSQFSEVVDGVYTGRPAGLFVYRSGKAEAIRALAQERGLDLQASYAYSDSESDMPMLEVVGHPVAVNPDKPLRRIARERGWEVLRFDHIDRRLKTAGALAGAGMLGGAVTLGGVWKARRERARHRRLARVRDPRGQAGPRRRRRTALSRA